jgi:predicted dehydrogenase
MSSWTEWRGYQLWLQIHGSDGALTAQYPPMLTLLDTNGTGGRARRRRFVFFRDQIIERIRSYRWTTEQSFTREFEEMIAAIHEDRDPKPDGYDGLRAVEIVYAIYESSEKGRSISLPPARRS